MASGDAVGLWGTLSQPFRRVGFVNPIRRRIISISSSRIRPMTRSFDFDISFPVVIAITLYGPLRVAQGKKLGRVAGE
jgi:hypothetical protein